MFGWLLPKETRFFDLFSKHAALITLAAEELHNSRDFLRIKELEHQADHITHECVEALHKTFITPIDRNDIFRLISHMDDIIDHIDVASRRYSIYKLGEETLAFKQLSEMLVHAAREVQNAINGLHDMSNYEPILESCKKINHCENQADVMLSHSLETLFQQEQDVRLVIKWKEIYEILEAATDSCEDVANIIEGIILEHA